MAVRELTEQQQAWYRCDRRRVIACACRTHGPWNTTGATDHNRLLFPEYLFLFLNYWPCWSGIDAR
jgi:hypothetical protein